MVTDVNYICHDDHFTIYTNIKSLYYLSGTNIYVVWEYTSSVAQSCPTLQPHELQHGRPPCPSPTPGVYSDSCPLTQWCHPTISSCHPLSLPPLIFPSIRVFSNESVLRIRWPKYWSFSFSISPSNEYSGLTSFRMDWLYLFVWEYICFNRRILEVIQGNV